MKKKLLSLLLACFAGVSANASEYDFEADGIYYRITSSVEPYTCEVTASESSEYSGTVTIAPSVTKDAITYSVTSIGAYAFEDCSGLTSVTIPGSVTSIGEGAFYCCTGLTSVIIPESVAVIGDKAFIGCIGLTTVTIPESVTSIGQRTFLHCSSLTAFYGKYASADNRCLIVEGVLRYFAPAGLTSYDIPESVTSIGDEAFYRCNGLVSVTIPASVTSIGVQSFFGCTALTSVVIPNSVTSIGGWAFSGCTGLNSVIVYSNNPANITLGEDVFYNASRTLYVPNGSQTLYAAAAQWDTFENIESIKNIIFYTPTNGEAITLDNVDKETFGANIISNTYANGQGAIVFDGDVTVIGYRAFQWCDDFTSVTIPGSVTSIGAYAFYSCHGLTSMTIPDSVTSIGDKAFEDCIGLTSVTIPETVTSIGAYAFCKCQSLTSVTIPDSVTSIGDMAFYRCTGLTSVTIPESVTAIGINVFGWCTALTEFNGKFASDDHRCLIVDGILNSFAPSGLTSYSIPGSVTTIGYSAFFHCFDLTSVIIPESVSSIGESAFDRCTSLSSLIIPISVTSIGDFAFYGCNSVTSITVENDNPANISLGCYVFGGIPQKTCVLYVPDGSKSLYEIADQWKDFANITEGGTSAIETIGADDIDADIYYDLMGRRVDNPTHGIYIRAGKKVLVK